MTAAQRAVIAFNDAINRRDLDALGRLMTDRHTFIDSGDNILAGKAEVLKAWDGFFRSFPDYRNEWSRTMRAGNRAWLTEFVAVTVVVRPDPPALGGARA